MGLEHSRQSSSASRNASTLARTRARRRASGPAPVTACSERRDMASDEKMRIARLATLFGSRQAAPITIDGGGIVPGLGVAAGDDCATIDISGRATLVWGSDYVRGEGFRLFQLGHLSYYDL